MLPDRTYIPPNARDYLHLVDEEVETRRRPPTSNDPRDLDPHSDPSDRVFGIFAELSLAS